MLDMSNAKRKQIQSKSAVDSSEDLRKALSEDQLKKAKQMFFNIRKSFFDSGSPMTRKDIQLAELIRLKILDTLLAEEF